MQCHTPELRNDFGNFLRTVSLRPKPRRTNLIGRFFVFAAILVSWPGARTELRATDDELPANAKIEADATKSKDVKDDASEAESISLHGRLVDETGQPVTDAKLKLWLTKNGQQKLAQSTDGDEEGNYAFADVEEKGEYEVEIESTRWQGLTGWNTRLRLSISPHSAQVRNLTLPRACRMKVRAVDEETGLPVKNVSLYAAMLNESRFHSPQPVFTDDDGWATFSRPKIADAKYLIGAMHQDYAFEQITQVLDDPDRVPRRTILLRKGKTLIGQAVCSDGKPPTGWLITAIPSWWKFGVYPNGYKIDEEGLFQLEHIVPGKYNVTISIPMGESTFTPHSVITEKDLTELEEPLEVKMDYPSPSSLVFITGQLKIEGDLPVNEGFWMSASSNVGNRFASNHIRGGATDFRLGPMPKGLYSIHISHPSIEEVALKNIAAPKEDLEIKIRARRKTQLRGIVLNGESGKPIEVFSVRVKKLRALGGQNFAEDGRWKGISDPQGSFTLDMNGAGEYQVIALASGFGPLTSETINTVEEPDKVVTLKLKPGVTLHGLVVDESGNPISGASVRSYTLSPPNDYGPDSDSGFPPGSIKTIDGRFSIPDLAEGLESLRVTHPDYCFNRVNDVEVKARATEPIRITLTQGATASGYVYNENGELERNVGLHFHLGPGYEFQHRQESQLVNVVTDQNGFYKAEHLPSQMMYVSRDATQASRGLVRRSILPENGQSYTLNFGGASRLTGRIQVNGQPLSETRIQLGSDNPFVGMMHQYAMTSQEGQFVMRGAVPGRWTLYCPVPGSNHQWIRLCDMEVPRNGNVELGLIELQTGRVTINPIFATEENLAEVYFQLAEFDPVQVGHRPAGLQVGRQSVTEPMAFEHVPPGDYEIICRWKNGLQFLQRLTTTKENLNATVTLSPPTGTASISGIVDRDILPSNRPRHLKLWSTDGRLCCSIQTNDEGAFQIENLPSGNYVVRDQDRRAAPILYAVELAEGEVKVIHLTKDNLTRPELKDGVLVVKVYSEDGSPIPCDVKFEGDQGRLTPNSGNQWAKHFAGPPGTYQVTIALAGFKSVSRRVEMHLAKQDGSNSSEHEITIRLEPE